MQANKLFLALAGGAALMMSAGVATAGIKNTKHNLGSLQGTNGGPNHLSPVVGFTDGTTTGTTDNTTEICVFCHTPHGADSATATVSAPLWNRSIATTNTYKMYDSMGTGTSATFSAKFATGNVGSVSLACLSCHDGGQAFTAVLNTPGSGAGNEFAFIDASQWEMASFSSGAATGSTGGDAIFNIANNLAAGTFNTASGSGDLSDDHPIGIEYCGGGYSGSTAVVASSATFTSGNCVDVDMKAPTSGTINGTLQFWVDTNNDNIRTASDFTLYPRDFGTNGTGPSVECASCHDPHVENVTFLRKTATTAAGDATGNTATVGVANQGSVVCLSCHNK